LAEDRRFHEGTVNVGKYDSLKTRLYEVLFDLSELEERIKARRYKKADESFAHFAKVQQGIHGLIDGLHCLSVEGFGELWNSGEDSKIDADSTAEVIELLDKLTKGWAKSQSPDEGTSSMTFENKGFGEVTKRLIGKRKDALDALAKQDAESDRDSAERKGTD